MLQQDTLSVAEAEPGTPARSSSTMQESAPPLRPDVLCSICEAVFTHITRHRERTFSWFHSAHELRVSVTKGCHFCTLIEGNIQQRRGYSLRKERAFPYNADVQVRIEERLKAETRYFPNVGVSFILRHHDALDHEVIAEVDLEVVSQDIAEKARAPHIGENTQSNRSWEQVVRWISQCSAEHNSCKSHQATMTSVDYPSRLIYVGNSSDLLVRLCETSKTDKPITYTTLSHCWGGHVPLQLLANNASSLMEGIELESLPRSFQDAIAVTRKLSVSFIWIDSLCIVQDSDSDWAYESSRMRQVYRGSYLNLAAAAAKDPTDGLFFQRPALQILPCNIKAGPPRESIFLRSKYEELRLRGELMPLDTRAWAYQEWLLAPRTLHYGHDELFWECRELNASETYPHGYVKTLDPYDEGLLLLVQNMRKDWQDLHHRSFVDRWILWCRVCEYYSERNLTRFSDKLVAISGLADELGRTWGDVQYLAGIWSYRLRGGLLWRCSTWSFKPSPLPISTTPSWSWASVDSRISMDPQYESNDGLNEVLNAEIQQLVPPSPYGQVNAGYIKIKGPMMKVRIYQYARRPVPSWYILFSDDYVEDMKDEPHPISSGHLSYLRSDDSHDSPESPESPEWNPRRKVSARIHLDDSTFESSLDIASVYMAPFQVSMKPNERSLEQQGLCLQGLILLPTFKMTGQFRRIGWFQVRDDWYNYDCLDQASPSGSIGDSCPTPSLEEHTMLDNCSQTPPDVSGQSRYLTATDVIDSEQKLNAKYSGRKEGGKNREWMEKMQTFMEDLQATATEDEKLVKQDRFHNGVVNKTLVDRYGVEMREAYPNINTLLTMISIRYSLETDQDLIPEWLYEEDHGDGYFTFHIV